MDTKKCMLIIKGKISTADVKTYQEYSIGDKCFVVYNNGGEYTYNKRNVKYLVNPKFLNPALYQIKNGSSTFSDVKEIYVFSDGREEYWNIIFGNGSERAYPKRQLEVIKSCLDEGKAQNVFEYLKQISGLSDIRNERTGEKLLEKRFGNLSFVGVDVALSLYINPDSAKNKSVAVPYIPIFPFGCNNSQYKAVKNAMENRISVIQGPPGTGKTQTILNIIANILMDGKTVQIVSNNNSATDNVYEKLSSPKYGLGFIAATLGKTENRKSFVNDQDGFYPDFSSWKLTDEQKISKVTLREKSQHLRTVFDTQEELAGLEQEKSQMETELAYFKQYVEETNLKIEEGYFKRALSSKQWMMLWQECQAMSDEAKEIGIIFKLKNFIRFGIWNSALYKQDIGKLITTFQMMYYRAREKELDERISEVKSFLESEKEGMLDELCAQSMLLLKDKLARKYVGKQKRVIFREEDLWKKSESVLEEYPVILSTTFSSKNSLNTNVIYDYLIMDEASQVDIATGALALSCARNVIIVGDTKQLPNVVTEDVKKKADAIFDSFKVSHGYHYTKSFLQSVLDVIPDVTQTMLREHYRCHPKIINFCNQKFYRNELIIMTKDEGEADVLVAVKTVEGNHARNHYSQRQIDVIREEVIPRFVTNPKETGIIAPYKNQAEALRREIPDIDAATVHKFQGKEKDTIIISTVDDEISDFADDPYLINVAVSRAKKKLVLVVSGNEQTQERNISDLLAYIRYNNFEVYESKIYSVFDYLYKPYTEKRMEYLKKHKKVSEFDSENLMGALIEDVLLSGGYTHLDYVSHFPMRMLIKDLRLLNEDECKYAMNAGTHIDFLLYNRISKKPVLAIEVDGYDYHKTGTDQSLRDLKKNHILELYELPLLRMKTNGSGEKERLLEVLKNLMK